MKTVIEMAREVGYPLVEFDGTPYIPPLLEVLLEAVRADEREACAELCDKQADSAYWEGADACAAAIRARGEASLRSNT